jgi:hypothetical protein
MMVIIVPMLKITNRLVGLERVGERPQEMEVRRELLLNVQNMEKTEKQVP